MNAVSGLFLFLSIIDFLLRNLYIFCVLQIDLKRAEFRQYLESTGVMEALSCALIKLYDESVKPNDPVMFVRKHFKRPNDVDKRIEDSDAAELIRKQQNELDMARQEIAKLRQTLNAMADQS